MTTILVKTYATYSLKREVREVTGTRGKPAVMERTGVLQLEVSLPWG
jgi:hypothetical protein